MSGQPRGVFSYKLLLRLAIVGLVAIFIGIAIGIYHKNLRSRVTQLSFLAVGQGDCAVFQHAGLTVVIDTGPSSPSGRGLVIRELSKLGIRSIDLLLLSHPDLDHVGGLKSIVHRFSVGKICVPRRFSNDTFMRTYLKDSGVDISQVYWATGKLSAQLGSFQLEFYEPPCESYEKDNEGSMFVKLSDGRCSVLFTGDASIEKEKQMLSFNKSWRAQILKAGHHGSQGSTGQEWLRDVKPQYVVLSCGRNNSYGHPHEATLQRIESIRAQALRTDVLGSISFKATPSGFDLIR